MSTGNGKEDPAKDPKAKKEIENIKELGKTGKVKEEFEKKHGKGDGRPKKG